MSPLYKRPPITEAVVEFRFTGAASREQIEKAQGRLSADEYSGLSEALSNFTFGVGSPPSTKEEFHGFRMTSKDASSIVIVARTSLSTSRMAPYEGWEQFIARAKANWAIWRKAVNWSPLARIGLRFINRIDVPAPEGEYTNIEQYLKLLPLIPIFDGVSPIDSFAINCALPIRDSKLRLILNAGSTPSPLLKTASFVLDLDLSQEIDMPTSDGAIWETVESMRPIKNRIFEASITDKARGLFSK